MYSENVKIRLTHLKRARKALKHRRKASGTRLAIIRYFVSHNNKPADAHTIAQHLGLNNADVKTNIGTLPPVGILEVVGMTSEIPRRSIYRLKDGWQERVSDKIRLGLESTEPKAA